MISVREAAELLKVSEKTIYRWIGEQDLPVFKVKDQYRLSRADLIEWASQKKVPVSPDIFKEPESESTPVPSLYEALQAGGVFYRVSGTDRESVLRAVVGQLRFTEGVDNEFLLQILLAREELASTGVGEGIAIPHLRAPVVLQVSKPSVSLCFLENPVDFKALDGKPVHALFTLVSPTIRAHLQLLSRLAFVLGNSSLKDLIHQCASREQIFEEIKKYEGTLPADILADAAGEA
jgi:nitrogen PTS system EIIA component